VTTNNLETVLCFKVPNPDKLVLGAAHQLLTRIQEHQIGDLITVATQAEEPILSNDVPEDDIAVFAARGENSTRGRKAEGGGS